MSKQNVKFFTNDSFDGQKLRILRALNSLSQEDLGKKIGVTRQTINNWENNRSRPNDYELDKLSNLLQNPMDVEVSEEEVKIDKAKKEVDEMNNTVKVILDDLREMHKQNTKLKDDMIAMQRDKIYELEKEIKKLKGKG